MKVWPAATVALMNLPPAVSALFAFSSMNPNNISPAACIHNTSTYWTGWWFLSTFAAHANDCVQQAWQNQQHVGAACHLSKAAPHAEFMYFKVRLGAAWQLRATCVERIGELRGVPFVMSLWGGRGAD